MTIILVIDLPGVTEHGPELAAQFADVLVQSDANDDAKIHTITSLVPNKKEKM